MAELVKTPIDFQSVNAKVDDPHSGAIITFSGVVRNNNRDRNVLAIDYHAYEEMALEQLKRIETEVNERWPTLKVYIVHRIGYLEVGESSVYIAIASPHRKEGYEASQYAINRIKEIVPIWKKEIYDDGYAWIEGS